MATILYLDVDDEITGAAARIRSARETKVALVLPPGSRMATSRINFRLLAREGLERNRVLSVVAADPAARAIAASAGLPVYASVAEFEAAIGPPSPPEAPTAQPPAPASASEKPPGQRRRAAEVAAAGSIGAAAAGAGATAAGAAAAGGAAPARAEQLSADLVAPPVPTPTPGTSIRSAPPASIRSPRGPVDAQPSRPAAVEPMPSVAAIPAETRARSGAATIPVVSARTGDGVPGRLIATVGAIVVALVIVAIVGYLVLPSAKVVVTPVAVPVGPVDFVVRADPDASSVDPTSGVIPATRLSKDFTASGEFDATGKRIVQTKAGGSLRWRNCSPDKPFTVPTGSVAETGSGVGFETLSAVFLPVATITGSPGNEKLTCSVRDVRARAVGAGPGGNVGAGTVTIVPTSFNSVVIKVTNPAAMTGGKRDEFPRIQQSDLDAAMASLTKDLKAQFDAWVAAPEELPQGSKVYPATAKLGTPVPSVDPATLLDVEEATFTLGATATGTVVAVDPSAIDQVADQRISANLPAEHALEQGSVTSTHDAGQVDGELVDFRVSARGRAIPVLDPAALREQIKGKSVEEARSILERYGTVTIDTWPGFVSSIPTIDARLDLTVGGAEGAPSPSPGPSASAP
jgi:hypothetical protein